MRPLTPRRVLGTTNRHQANQTENSAKTDGLENSCRLGGPFPEGLGSGSAGDIKASSAAWFDGSAAWFDGSAAWFEASAGCTDLSTADGKLS